MESVVNAIPYGKENAIHLHDLSVKLGMPETAIKNNVRLARTSGIPILSGACGYWRSDSDHEKYIFCNSMRKSAFRRIHTAKSVRADVANDPAQMILDFGD